MTEKLRTAAKAQMAEPTDDSIRLLMNQAANLQRQLDRETTLPRPEKLAKLAGDLAKALEKLEKRTATLERENQALTWQKASMERRLVESVQHNRALQQQNLALKRETRALEKRSMEQENRLANLAAERKRYHDLFEHAPDAYLTTDAGGKIEEANQAAQELLNRGAGDLIGTPLIKFIAPQNRKVFETLLARMRRMQDMELTIHPHNMPPFDASITMATVYDEAGQPARLRWLLRDVTERRQALAALNASERRFRAIFNEANLGIVLVDPHGSIARCNCAFQEMLGYTEEELYGKPLEMLIPVEERSTSRAAVESLHAGGRPSLRQELRYCHKDGRTIWASEILSVLNDEQGQPQFIMRMVENVTSEKQATAELAEMRRRLLESGEVERLRLAQELHDGPMQDLYGAVFRITNFQEENCDAEMRANLAEIQTTLKHVAGKLRTVCGDLRPPTIANLGLERAIRSHADRIQEEHPEIEVQLHLSNDGQLLPAHTRLAFFRIYQQCMANVLHHAQASKVIIALHINDSELIFDVWDNGKGFLLPGRWVDLLRGGHYGLASIAERVEALNGDLKIETKPGAGTLIHITAPRGEAE